MGSSKRTRPRPIASVGGVYDLKHKVGSGSFGEIFHAVNAKTGEELAVKLEKRSDKRHSILMHEAKLLKDLQGTFGVASMHYCNVEGSYNVMVMDLLGASLEDLFRVCNRKFSLKTVMMIADQMLYRIEHLHSKGCIHRDIKPDNFMIGRGENASTIYIIDFGLAKRYRDPQSKQHMAYRENRGFTGTARYASVNAHKGIEQSRRDDVESILYALLYLLRGRLPWQGIRAKTKEEKQQQIMKCKESISVEDLCEGCPRAFAVYFNYVRSLRFNCRPDYGLLRRLFKDCSIREGLYYDSVYDWSTTGYDHQVDCATASLPQKEEMMVGHMCSDPTQCPPSVHDGASTVVAVATSVQRGGGSPLMVATDNDIEEEYEEEQWEPVAEEQAPKAKTGGRKKSVFRSLFGCMSKSAVREG